MSQTPISKPRLVILSGAGISAESGLQTFRGSDGLWEGHRIEDVATPQAWRKNPALVLEFYNQRRRAAYQAQPNAGHQACVDLEAAFDVHIITQNVDNLHEKAGSTQVLHLHGELDKARSERDEDYILSLEGRDIVLGDRAPDGSQLRPHIVWFGEAVPMMETAIALTQQADVFVVVGTSLQVYPAASLLDFVPVGSPIYVVDPHLPRLDHLPEVIGIEAPASMGMPRLAQQLLGTI